MKALKHLRQHVEKRCLIRSDRKHAASFLRGVRQRISRLIVQAQQASRVLQEDFAGRRQAHCLSRTVKQPLLVIVFKLPNLRADRGLRSKHFGSRPREVTFFGDLDECLEVI